MANPSDVVGADIEINEGSLALIVSDHEVGEWPLDDVGIEVETDGFHMLVDGEEFVFTTPQAAAFAAAVGVATRPEPAPDKPAAKKARGVKPQKPQKAFESTAPRKAPRVRLGRPRIYLSNPRTRIAAIAVLVCLLLAIFARPLLAGLMMITGFAGLLISAGAMVDPLLATRLPEDLPASRLLLVAVAVAVTGMTLLVI